MNKWYNPVNQISSYNILLYTKRNLKSVSNLTSWGKSQPPGPNTRRAGHTEHAGHDAGAAGLDATHAERAGQKDR
jgi:hypothetical protein